MLLIYGNLPVSLKISNIYPYSVITFLRSRSVSFLDCSTVQNKRRRRNDQIASYQSFHENKSPPTPCQSFSGGLILDLKFLLIFC